MLGFAQLKALQGLGCEGLQLRIARRPQVSLQGAGLSSEAWEIFADGSDFLCGSDEYVCVCIQRSHECN